MGNVQAVKKWNIWWWRYYRIDEEGNKDTTHPYLHCTCVHGENHGAMDVRCNEKKEYPNPTSFPTLPKVLQQHIDHGQERRKMEADARAKIHAQQLSSVPPIEREKDNLNLLWDEYVADAYLSDTAATRSSFFLFVHAAMEVARKFPSVPVEQLFPSVSRKEFSRDFARQADTSHALQIASLQGKYVSVCMDASTIAHKHILAVFLVNPSTMKPILYDIYHNVSTQADYTSVCIDLHNDLELKGIKIASICTDGLTAQTNALRESYHGLYHSLFCTNSCFPICIGSKPTFPAFLSAQGKTVPLFAPCYAHRSSLTMKRSQYLHNGLEIIVSSIITMSQTLNKDANASIVGTRCPQFVEVRWLSLFDICKFVKGSQESILKVPLDPQQRALVMLSPLVFQILLPLHLFILRVESDTCSVVQVFPYLLQTLYRYEFMRNVIQLKGSVWDEIILSLMTAFVGYTLGKEEGDTMVTAFGFSEIGRNAFSQGNIFCNPTQWRISTPVSIPQLDTKLDPVAFVTAHNIPPLDMLLQYEVDLFPGIAPRDPRVSPPRMRFSSF
jgi:hypothetical protein